MKYLMMIVHSEAHREMEVPPSLYEAMGGFVEEYLKNGMLKDTGGLKPSKDGYRVRMSGRKLKTIDGPFTETKEVVGGYAIVEVPNKEEADRIAQRFMQIHLDHWPEFEGECQVRPVEDM
jgi:hypothetical protein